MRTARRQFGTWVLLLIFGMQAMAPGMSARWLLCLGCDETGFALEARPPASVQPDETCCLNESSGEGPEFRAQDCGCVRLAIDSVGPSVWTASRAAAAIDEVTPTSMLWPRAAMALGIGGFGQRGPPAHEPPPIGGSLLSQRTCLLI